MIGRSTRRKMIKNLLVSNACLFNSRVLCPIFSALGFSIPCDSKSITAVPSLLIHRSPFAVTRFVIPVVVSALKRVFGCWPIPHVVEEISEFAPPLADLNPASAIPCIASIVWVGAPTIHGCPSNVFGSARQSVFGARDENVSLQTSARTAVTRDQLNNPNCSFSSARTTTQPKVNNMPRVCRLTVRIADDLPSVKLTSYGWVVML